MIDGTPIVSQQFIKNCSLPVVIASKFVKEIDRQLEAMGIQVRIPHYVLSAIFPQEFPNEFHQGAIEQIEQEWDSVEAAYELMQDEYSRNLFSNLIHFRHTLQPSDLPEPQIDQYFPAGFWSPDENEVFVDIGAYNGDTLMDYLFRCRGDFKQYIAIEPDTRNFERLVDSVPLKYRDKIITLNIAVGTRNSKHVFSNSGSVDASFSNVAAQDASCMERPIIETYALDDLLAGKDISTIKMDVEGWEPFALAGAEQIIHNQQPRLAVCVYHRPEHYWSLPLQIIRYNSQYEFFLRHHESEIYETVLYCVPSKV